MIINFDMDGTIVDLYNVNNWLSKLREHDVSPYLEAVPLLRLSQLSHYLNKLQSMGHKITILSWTSKDPDTEYHNAVTRAKRKWLRRHLPSVTFDRVIITPYGVPKHLQSSGILFDDEVSNREAWKQEGRSNQAYAQDKIFEVLKTFAAGAY